MGDRFYLGCVGVAALALLAILVIAAAAQGGARGRFCGGGGAGGGAGGACAGGRPPENLGLYDVPYYYPDYEARSALKWDSDKRCASFCQTSPCAVWCR